MKKHITFTLSCVMVLPLLLSCNVFQPFNVNVSDQDHIEEALKCLHNGDYACASTNYGLISDPTLKAEKVCEVNIARAGLTLDALLNVVTQNNSKMLGTLANALMPFSQDKYAAAAAGLTSCGDYVTAVGLGTTGVQKTAALLKAMSLLVHCSIGITRANVVQGTDPADEACTTAGSNTGVVTAEDVCPGGSCSGAGMCKTDVDNCLNDIVNIDSTVLSSLGGLSKIQSALTTVKNAIGLPGSTALGRTAIQTQAF